MRTAVPEATAAPMTALFPLFANNDVGGQDRPALQYIPRGPGHIAWSRSALAAEVESSRFRVDPRLGNWAATR
jgi:hypothetical protein